MAKQAEVVVLGGGNSAGYVAQAWVKSNGGKGGLMIVGDEPVSWGGVPDGKRGVSCVVPLCACKHCKLCICVHDVSMEEARHEAREAAQLATSPAAATAAAGGFRPSCLLCSLTTCTCGQLPRLSDLMSPTTSLPLLTFNHSCCSTFHMSAPP